MKRFSLILRGLLIPALLGVASCGRTDVPVASETAPAATTAPGAVGKSLRSANVAVSGHVVKMADGVDLTQVRNQEMIHPAFSMSPPDVDSAVLLASVVNDKDDTGSPVVLKKIDDQWKVLELTEAGDQEWVYAGACGPRKELWGILDSATDTPVPQLTLMRSADDGLTWQFFAAVKKPADDAEYAAFSMAANGEGKLSVHLADDADKILHGYYHYRTVDGGKTWMGPTFEADDVTDADSQRDLDSIQEAIRDAEAVPAQ
ncbi:MAG TPA: hypothetical protein VM008_12485 [Phycisphaerae bacterium]|nr:hypothetical protein [Phycisphaerae bacterium]